MKKRKKVKKKAEVRRSCIKGKKKVCECLSVSFRFSFYAYSLHVFPSSYGRWTNKKKKKKKEENNQLLL